MYTVVCTPAPAAAHAAHRRLGLGIMVRALSCCHGCTIFFRILFLLLVSCGAGLAGGNPHKIKVSWGFCFFCFSVFILVFFWHTIDVQEFMRRIRRLHKFFLLSAGLPQAVLYFFWRSGCVWWRSRYFCALFWASFFYFQSFLSYYYGKERKWRIRRRSLFSFFISFSFIFYV